MILQSVSVHNKKKQACVFGQSAQTNTKYYYTINIIPAYQGLKILEL